MGRDGGRVGCFSHFKAALSHFLQKPLGYLGCPGTLWSLPAAPLLPPLILKCPELDPSRGDTLWSGHEWFVWLAPHHSLCHCAVRPGEGRGVMGSGRALRRQPEGDPGTLWLVGGGACVSGWRGGRREQPSPPGWPPVCTAVCSPPAWGLLWLWARSWLLELLGLEEPRAAKRGGEQMGRCSSWAPGVARRSAPRGALRCGWMGGRGRRIG